MRYIPIIGGGGGIRTHEPFRTTAFRVRPVMTTSILLHTFQSDTALTNNSYFTIHSIVCQVLFSENVKIIKKVFTNPIKCDIMTKCVRIFKNERTDKYGYDDDSKNPCKGGGIRNC